MLQQIETCRETALAIEKYIGTEPRVDGRPQALATSIRFAAGAFSGIVDVDELCFGDPRYAPALTLVAMLVALFGLSLALDVAGRVAVDGEVGFAARWATIGAGVAHALVASLAFACVLYLTTRWLAALEPRLRTVLTMSVVSVVTLGAGLVGGGLALPAQPLAWTGLVLLTILYGTAFTMMFAILPRIGAVDNAALLNFEPIASLGLAWLFLGQAVAPIQVFGALVVIGAVMAIGMRRG